MAHVIKLPRLSDTMEEGKIEKWYFAVGDTISEGDVIVDIETDKAIQGFDVEYEGTLLHIGLQEGESAKVDSIIAIIGEEGEDISDLIAGGSADTQDTDKSTDSDPTKGPTEVAEDRDDMDEVEPDEEDAEKSEKADKKKAEADESDESDDSDDSDDEPAAIPEGVHVINMPRLSDTMAEGTVVEWHFQEGDEVKEGDVIADIETDKAIQGFDTEYDGVLLHIGVKEGESVAVDSILAIIGPAGTDVSGVIKAASQKPKTDKKPADDKKKEEKKEDSAPKKSAEEKSDDSKSGKSKVSSERIFISPLARKLAEEKGYDIDQIAGSGDQGRIVKRDVEKHVPVAEKKEATKEVAQVAAQFGDRLEEKSVPNSQMRKVIARRLSESKFTAPHYYLNVEVNMDNMIAARKQLNEIGDVKISFNDLIVKATAMALLKHPQVNTVWTDQAMQYKANINIGVAVAVPDGLVVPVVRNADMKSLSTLATEIRDLAGRSRDKKVKADELEGSTFTVSNLGAYGIESFTSIINQPNSCILSVGAIVEKPVVKDGQIVVGNTMMLTLACDHRTVDGATGALFLQTLTQYLQTPLAMLI